MSRSIKKGPFVEARLLARIEALNESGDKKVLKPGRALPLYSLRWWVIPSLFMTAKNTYLSILLKIWLAISSESSLPHATSAAMVVKPSVPRL